MMGISGRGQARRTRVRIIEWAGEASEEAITGSIQLT